MKCPHCGFQFEPDEEELPLAKFYRENPYDEQNPYLPTVTTTGND